MMVAPGASHLGTWESTNIDMEQPRSFIPQRFLPECHHSNANPSVGDSRICPRRPMHSVMLCSASDAEGDNA